MLYKRITHKADLTNVKILLVILPMLSNAHSYKTQGPTVPSTQLVLKKNENEIKHDKRRQ